MRVEYICLDISFLVCGPCDNIEEYGIFSLKVQDSHAHNTGYHISMCVGKTTCARQLSLFSQSVQQKGCLEECMGTAAFQKGSCV